MKTKFLVGTSGWSYDWNEGRTLDWYVSNSGLNAVELNSSFYRFPFPNQVKGWAKRSGLSWSIKVNRSITHMYKFSEKAVPMFEKFEGLFKPMDNVIDNYLFQLPPSVEGNKAEVVLDFIARSGLSDRAVVEPRAASWFNDEIYSRFKERGVTMCSIDSPIGSFFAKTTHKIYLRLHGRKSWYTYKYSNKELRSIINTILNYNPKEAFIFFNNDHDMLKNARELLKIIESI